MGGRRLDSGQQGTYILLAICYINTYSFLDVFESMVFGLSGQGCCFFTSTEPGECFTNSHGLSDRVTDHSAMDK